MKPVIILPPGQMNSTNMKMLRDNGFCVVVAKNPSAVQFIDPIPAVSNRTEIESAAIKLSRKVMNPGFWGNSDTRDVMCRTFMDILMNGTPLDPRGTKEEQERVIQERARQDELAKIAREEARAEREAKRLKQPLKSEPASHQNSVS